MLTSALAVSLILSLVIGSGSAQAQNASDNVEHIVDIMVRLCVGGGTIRTVSGGGTGGATVSLRSFDIKGNLSGEFKITKSNAEGIVNGIDNAMTQIAAGEADKVRACLAPVRKRVLDLLLPGKQSRACRIPSNGVDHYTREFDVTRDSPEMGGGHTQDEWCKTMISELRGEHPYAAFKVLTKSEHTNNHCPPFNCPQYVYKCTVHVWADPVFKLKVSSACS